MTTLYRLATSPADYRKCHALLNEKAKLSFPTVMAEYDGELLGFYSTQKHNNAVIGGPVFIREDKRGGFIMLRLAEAYDNVLWKAGVRKYLIFTEPGREAWISLLTRLGFAPLGEHEGRFWLERRLEAA